MHARGKRLSESADLDAVERLTRGMAGADLANVMNEAALLSARRESEEISTPVLEEAIERAGFGIGGARKMVLLHSTLAPVITVLAF